MFWGMACEVWVCARGVWSVGCGVAPRRARWQSQLVFLNFVHELFGCISTNQRSLKEFLTTSKNEHAPLLSWWFLQSFPGGVVLTKGWFLQRGVVLKINLRVLIRIGPLMSEWVCFPSKKIRSICLQNSCNFAVRW